MAGILLCILFGTSAFAQSYRMNASYFLRSDKNSSGEVENRIGVLTAGSEFKVLNRKGNALQIEITKLSPTSRVRKSEQVWIWKGNTTDFTELDTKTEVNTEAQSPQVKCDNCEVTAAPSTEVKKKNVDSLHAVTREITNQVNQVAVTEPKAALTEARVVVPASAHMIKETLDQKIKDYSESSEVAAAISWAQKHNGLLSYRKCYRQVKIALTAKDKQKNSLIPSHYSDEAAIGAKDSLKKYGFINLMDFEPYKTTMTTPSQAPKGAVLVYSSGIRCPNSKIKDCGHVEIKASQTSYVSDYKSAYAINETPRAKMFGTKYKLIGIMIKPMENK